MPEFWTHAAGVAVDIVTGLLGERGAKMVLGQFRKKLLPRIVSRVQVRISHNQHFVHGANPSRKIEFVGYIDNLTPVNVTIISGKMQIYNHDIPMGETEVIRTEIPKETANGRITLGYLNPVLSAVNLPNSNARWKLEVENLTFVCSFGTWLMPKLESEYFSVISTEGWEKTIAWVREVRQHPDGYRSNVVD